MICTETRKRYEEICDKLSHSLSYDRAFIGFDGFIDEIVHVVDQRLNVGNYTRVKTLSAFGERICRAAGLSTNIEYVPIQVKLGGNGTIFANALLNYRQDVTYVGAVGLPPSNVFASLIEKAKIFSIAEPALTDAVEFDDGKLIISKLESFKSITFERIVSMMGLPALISEVEASTFIAFMNWTMIPAMTDIWKAFLANVAPSVSGRKIIFFDLADPEKRTKSDLIEALSVIRQFAPRFRAMLGLNLKEAKQAAAALDLEPVDDLERLARGIAAELMIEAVVIHPVNEACAVVGDRYVRVQGPYSERPLLTTGAGDNFNAGLCFGLMQGWTMEQALAMGTASSGFYVRKGRSANINEITRFILDLSQDCVD